MIVVEVAELGRDMPVIVVRDGEDIAVLMDEKAMRPMPLPERCKLCEAALAALDDTERTAVMPLLRLVV